MLRKRKEAKPRKKILETLLRDMQGTAEQKLALFEKLTAAGGFANESIVDLRKVENMLRVCPRSAPLGDHSQQRQSLRPARHARGAGSDQRARPGSGYIGNPTSPGSRCCSDSVRLQRYSTV